MAVSIAKPPKAFHGGSGNEHRHEREHKTDNEDSKHGKHHPLAGGAAHRMRSVPLFFDVGQIDLVERKAIADRPDDRHDRSHDIQNASCDDHTKEGRCSADQGTRKGCNVTNQGDRHEFQPFFPRPAVSGVIERQEKGGDVKVTFFPGPDFLKLRLVVGGILSDDLGFRDSAKGRDGIVGLRVGLWGLVGGAGGFAGGARRRVGRGFCFL